MASFFTDSQMKKVKHMPKGQRKATGKSFFVIKCFIKMIG